MGVLLVFCFNRVVALEFNFWGSGVEGLGFGLGGQGYRLSLGLEFWVWVWGPGLWVSSLGLGFRVSGFGIWGSAIGLGVQQPNVISHTTSPVNEQKATVTRNEKDTVVPLCRRTCSFVVP